MVKGLIMAARNLNGLFAACGSDKGAHNYGPAYEFLLSGIRHKPLLLLELGVAGGASLRAWEQYLPNARILGADFDPECEPGPRTRIEILDQSKRADLERLGADAPYDVIIDDCSHLPGPTTLALEVLWSMLKVGGLYIIEDLEVRNYPEFQDGTTPIFDQVVNRLAKENHGTGLQDRITIVAGELVAFVKVK
jgi:predicted O-methyltransferase YrrM